MAFNVRSILLKRFCYCLPLQYGAIFTFMVSTGVSLLPLTSLPGYINKISIQDLILNSCQIAFSSFVGVFALMGTIQKQPHFILPFLTYYLGCGIIDLGSVVCTIVIGYPFNAHNLLRGKGVEKKPVTKGYYQIFVLLYLIFFALRIYFTFIVFCYYEHMKKPIEPDAPPDNSEDSSAIPGTSKGSKKASVTEI